LGEIAPPAYLGLTALSPQEALPDDIHRRRDPAPGE
jgi:hypothetical protein